MKNSKSPNLYELLKRSSAQSMLPAESVKETATATVEPLKPPVVEPAGVPLIEYPDPEPVVQTQAPPPHPPSPAPLPSPGQRVVTLTYNSFLFFALIGGALLFTAYALGVRVGKNAILEQSIPKSTAANPSDPMKRVWSIRLKEWPATTSRERTAAQDDATRLKDALHSRGLTEAWIHTLPRDGKTKLALSYGRFTDPSNPNVKKILEFLRAFKPKGASTPVFAASISLEETTK